MDWFLVSLSLLLNGADIGVSYLAIQAGAWEVGFLYPIGSCFWAASLVKMALASVVACLLIRFERTWWLIWLNLGMALIILLNWLSLGVVLWMQKVECWIVFVSG